MKCPPPEAHHLSSRTPHSLSRPHLPICCKAEEVLRATLGVRDRKRSLPAQPQPSRAWQLPSLQGVKSQLPLQISCWEPQVRSSLKAASLLPVSSSRWKLKSDSLSVGPSSFRSLLAKLGQLQGFMQPLEGLEPPVPPREGWFLYACLPACLRAVLQR